MKPLLAALVLSLAAVATPAQAGVYTDDLSRCLVSRSTDADKQILVRWIFSAIALHKDLAPYVDIPADERDRINRDAGALFTRLLAETCVAETRAAVSFEGQETISAAFAVLGQVAGKGLFASPEVNGGMDDLMQHIDQDKLKAVMTPEAKPNP